MTAVRLAFGFTCNQHERSLAKRDLPPPHTLVSYAYWASFAKVRHRLAIRDYVLDSGAFTAHASGKPVELQRYIEFCTWLLSFDRQLTEIFALDVIGDEKASLRNAELMWEAGVPAIPTFHFGESIDALMYLAKHYPKLALGGSVGVPGPKKRAWLTDCMTRIWPKPAHGFGVAAEKLLMACPLHSADASNWLLSPAAHSRWMAFGGHLPARGVHCNVRAEVDYWLEVERKVRIRWEREMEEIAPLYAVYQAEMEKARRVAA